ncbi:MAG: hypothetical protein ACNA71_10235, partial [Kiritimatiellia bacterium]
RSLANSVRSISFTARGAYTRLTGLTLSGTPLLFHYQRQSAADATRKSPFLLPRYPQSTQAFYAHDETADMHLSILRTQAAPAQVREFYGGTMQADGWHMPVSAMEARPEGMIVFIRQQEVACIGIEQVNNRTETRITLLHKRLKIQ